MELQKKLINLRQYVLQQNFFLTQIVDKLVFFLNKHEYKFLQ